MSAPVIAILVSAVVVGALKLLTWALNRYTARKQAELDAWHELVVTEHGMLPEEQQNTDRACPSPELDALRATATGGDWQACAEGLAEAGRDPDRRYRIVGELADVAAEEDDWLRTWRAERPGDPDAALVHAEALVKLAWRLRGAAYAEHTSDEQADGFHRMLTEARAAAHEAQELAPQDPLPWTTELWIALGLNYPPAEFDRVWAGLTARDPHLYPAHYAAVQYKSAKWHGSEEEANAFADRAATGAPAGSLLAGMRLIALFEHEPDDNESEYWSTPYARSAVDAARRAVDAAPADHPRAAEIRHLLAWCYTMTDRPAEALAQFKLVDGYVDALPWRYTDEPAAFYCRIRAIAARFAAKEQLAA
ncbi:hypothetical protein [Kitasatospora sp. A2-31]|uniref:hypothetical protein n=1 Tax=Kitasatospora sp. A2-31 TaxID=2916414 RepID=UPI001EEB006A|nr:hypothetical protein [Kitasatospora sp. A2-31]MCG6494119.1 hypothetical protein [Kitasatospora sp. A2-31]